MTCLLCPAPAEVSWPVRRSPHCRRCVEKCERFIAETDAKLPRLDGIVGREERASS